MLLLIQYTLIFASVLILVALGGCFSEHSGVINIGLEGIMVMGALGGALMMKFAPAGLPALGMIVLVVAGRHGSWAWSTPCCWQWPPSTSRRTRPWWAPP